MHQEIAAGRRAGAVVFLGGDDSSGRPALMRSIGTELRRSRSTVVSGSFDHSGFTAWGHEDPSRSIAFEILKSVTPMAGALSPAVALISLFISHGNATWQLLSRIKERGVQVDPALLLPQILRLSAQDRPVVCIIDYAVDGQTGWWEDLLALFAQEVANDLPVLLVIGLEGPARLAEEFDVVPAGHFAARTLVRRRLAEWWPLGALARDDLLEWIGPADQTVVDALWEAGHSRSAITAQLWAEWEAVGVVEQRKHDPRWSFTTGGRGHVVTDRLKRLVQSDGALPEFERARELLAVAALEGRQFTAEAVGVALGLERDAILDYIDEALAIREGNPDGIVKELGHVTIVDGNEERAVWLYEFVRTLDHMTLRESLTSEEEARYSERLAHALVECYGTGSPVVVATAARLFQRGSNFDLATHFWRMTRTGQDDEITVWRATRLLEGDEPDGLLERRMATEMLLDAVNALYNRGPFTDGLAFSQAALELADDGSSDQGLALYYSAWFRNHLGQGAQARTDLEAALTIAQRLNLTERIADANHQIANLDFEDKNYVDAHRRYKAVLEVRIQRQDLTGVATVRQRLADLAQANGDIEGARMELKGVLSIVRGLDDLHRQASVLIDLGRIDAEQGRNGAARARYKAALDVSCADESPYMQAVAHFRIAALDHRLGDLVAARTGYARAVNLAAGAPELQATAHHRLGSIEAALDNTSRAVAHYRTAIDIYRGLGDSDNLKQTKTELDDLVDG